MSAEHEQHVKDWYAKLCAEMRQAEIKKPEVACAHCGRPAKDHNDREMRCDLYVTSQKFRAVNLDAIKTMCLTAEALEKLACINGWKL